MSKNGSRPALLSKLFGTDNKANENQVAKNDASETVSKNSVVGSNKTSNITLLSATETAQSDKLKELFDVNEQTTDDHFAPLDAAAKNSQVTENEPANTDLFDEILSAEEKPDKTDVAAIEKSHTDSLDEFFAHEAPVENNTVVAKDDSSQDLLDEFFDDEKTLQNSPAIASKGTDIAQLEDFSDFDKISSAEPTSDQTIEQTAGVATVPDFDLTAIPAKSAENILQTSQTQKPDRVQRADHTQFSPAEARQSVNLANHQVMGPWDDRASGQSLVELYPDEYIYDGGDRDLPVHYDDYTRFGLETEDTVAEYTDHRGRPRVKPSNRVAIYAPRFGAVRTISHLEAGISIEQVHIATDELQGSGLTSQLAPGAHLQRDPATGLRMRSRVSGLETQTGDLIINQNVAASRHAQNLNTLQNLTFFRSGQFEQAEKARLSYGIQAAATWSRTQYPVVTASNSEAQQIKAHFRESVLVGIESDKRDGDLRIVKTADRKEAQIGDIVTFTIRYDNLGDLELQNIRIIDNLTPRMEYVDDSAHSDRPGRLVVEDNREGSLILKFEVDEPLPGREGGTVTFQARVR